MNAFNISQFARFAGCIASVAAALMSASITRADSPRGLQPSQHPAYVYHYGQGIAPTNATPNSIRNDRWRQQQINGTRGGGCFGQPTLPKSIRDQLSQSVRPEIPVHRVQTLPWRSVH